nr:hypothetical protein [Paracraurococcus ruber]
MRPRTSGARTAARLAWWMRRSTSSGVPAGANMAKSVVVRKPGSPSASATVGTCGSSGVRWSPVTARIRTSPERTKGRPETASMQEICTSPATSAWVAGAPPR